MLLLCSVTCPSAGRTPGVPRGSLPSLRPVLPPSGVGRGRWPLCLPPIQPHPGSPQLASPGPQARYESQRLQLESELAVRLEQQVTERLAQAQESSLRQAAALRENHRCWALPGAPLPGRGQCWAVTRVGSAASPCPSQAHFPLPLSPTSVF